MPLRNQPARLRARARWECVASRRRTWQAKAARRWSGVGTTGSSPARILRALPKSQGLP